MKKTCKLIIIAAAFIVQGIASSYAQSEASNWRVGAGFDYTFGGVLIKPFTYSSSKVTKLSVNASYDFNFGERGIFRPTAGLYWMNCPKAINMVEGMVMDENGNFLNSNFGDAKFHTYGLEFKPMIGVRCNSFLNLFTGPSLTYNFITKEKEYPVLPHKATLNWTITADFQVCKRLNIYINCTQHLTKFPHANGNENYNYFGCGVMYRL